MTSRAFPIDKSIQLQSENRFQSLCSDNDNGTDVNTLNVGTSNTKTKEPTLPPIYGVNDYKAILEHLAQLPVEKTYFTKSLSNGTVKINPYTSDTYRKIIKHLSTEGIIHHTYQPKHERTY